MDYFYVVRSRYIASLTCREVDDQSLLIGEDLCLWELMSLEASEKLIDG